MIKTDDMNFLTCDSCRDLGKVKTITFGADLSHRGIHIWLCDTCINELKDKLNNMEVKNEI